MKKVALFSAILFLFVYCSSKDKDQKITKFGKGFALVGGAPISQFDTDDYNPQVIMKPDGFLILIFGSNRTTGIGGGPGSNHYIWGTTSTAPYDPIFGMPPFNTPVQLNVVNLGSATSKIAFSAGTDGGSGATLVYTEQASGNSEMYIATVTDFASGNPDSEAQFKGEATTTNRMGTVIGNTSLLAGQPEFVYKESTSNTFKIAQNANPSPVTDGTLDTNGVSEQTSIAPVPQFLSGQPNSYFFTNVDPSGTFSFVLAGSNGDVVGEPIGLNEALFFEGLAISNLGTFAGGPGPEFSGMVFSAGFDLNGDQDLFFVTSHDLAGLWQLNLGPQNNIQGPAFSFLPPDMPGLVTWHDAFSIFDPPGAITQWYDNMFNVDLMSGGTGPTFDPGIDTTLGLPIVKFDGSAINSFDSNSLANVGGSLTVGTVFAVANYNTANLTFPGNTNNWSLVQYGGNSMIEGVQGTSNITTTFDTVRINGHGSTNTEDFGPVGLHKIITAIKNTPAAASPFVVGNNISGWNGDLGELLIFDRTLDAGEIDTIEKYLSAKFGIPLYLPNKDTAISSFLQLWFRADQDLTATSSLGGPAAVANLVGAPASPNLPYSVKPTFFGRFQRVLDVTSAETTFGGIDLGTQHTVFLVINPDFSSMASPQSLFDNTFGATSIRVDLNAAGGPPHDQVTITKDGGAFEVSSFPIPEDDYTLITVRTDGANTEVFINGGQFGNINQSFTVPSPTGIKLGKTTGGLAGGIAEVLVYNGAAGARLTEPQRQKVECYLKGRYDLPISNGICP